MEELDVYKFGKGITWSVPVLFQYDSVWGAIYKKFFDVGIQLEQVNAYGAPGIAWGGGRAAFAGRQYNKEALKRHFVYLDSIKATPSFTFTYTDLTKEDLNDRYANYVLDAALETGAHFIVYSDLLKNHIKEKNPDAYVVASVIKPAVKFQAPEKINQYEEEEETAFYNELLKEYDMVVVRPEYSLKTLLEHPETIDDISRIEVLINQTCLPFCPLMPNHYKYLQAMRFGMPNRNEQGPHRERFKCYREFKPDGLDTFKQSLVHSDDIIRKLIDCGVKHLKIQGRGENRPPELQAMLIFNHIFNIHNPSYLIMCGLMSNVINQETQFFRDMFRTIRMDPPLL